jgi:nucleoside phosphorylase
MEDKRAKRNDELRSLSPEQYTVGWICALGKELTAAKAMLDERHQPLKTQPSYDKNSYTLGNIGPHNIVLVPLPEYGTNKAAFVSAWMTSTFRRIRFGLMIGIGGGIPSRKNDIRLGDIVVSKGDGQSGGVVQYDMGKMEKDGFHRTGSLDKPPLLLRTAQVTLSSELDLGKDVFALVEQEFHDNSEWLYPAEAKDVLFQASYDHIEDDDDCEDCCDFSSENLVARKPEIRKTLTPKIHYGNIGSGNKVIKNATERDLIGKRDKVICFEMEAAGLQDHFPCMVIRGVCDYSDSHKNKEWQEYAAAVAAAYAKKLLEIIRPEGVEVLEPIKSK